MPVEEQVAIIYASARRARSTRCPTTACRSSRRKYLAHVRANHAGSCSTKIRDGKKWTDELIKSCAEIVKQFKGEFLA